MTKPAGRPAAPASTRGLLCFRAFRPALLLLPLLFLFSCTGGERGPKIYEQEKVLMGTVFSFKSTADGLDEEAAEAAYAEAFREIARLESQMSEWIEESPISQVSREAGKRPVAVPEELQEVAALALEIARTTDGAFDCTFLPLGRLWDVKQRTLPPPVDSLEAARRLVDWRSVMLDRKAGTLYLGKKGMRIGFGGIAKGYAARKAGEVLERAGITDYIVNAGGDLYVSGTKAGTPWRSGVADPRRQGAPPVTSFSIRKRCGIATSGDYENYFIWKGKRYHHIIDLRTSLPAEGMRSSTVFAEDPAKADAYATAFFILGPLRALEIVRRDTTLAYILIDSSGTIHRSPNLSGFIEE